MGTGNSVKFNGIFYAMSTVGLAHDYDQPEEVNVSERQGVRGHAGAHFKGFEE